jgi:hypothetical protein
MPYIPPHLRPGYIPSKPVEKPDLRGRVHWPTDKDKDTNILESSKVHEPHLGIMAAKSAVKLTKPITMNSEPLAKPRMHLGHSKFNMAVRRHLSKKFKSKKRVSRRRSMSHKKKTKTMTYKRKTY